MNTPSSLLNRVRSTTRAYDEALREAKTFTSEDLTPQAAQRARLERAEAARQTLGAAVAEIRPAAAASAARIRANLGRRPAAPASTAEAWARVKMRLDAGHALGQIIREADASTLHAIGAWAPTWLKVNATDGATVDLAPLERALSLRWADVTGDLALRQAIDDAPVLAELEAALDSAERVAGGDDSAGGLAGALAARQAREEAEAVLPVRGVTQGAQGGLMEALAARFENGARG